MKQEIIDLSESCIAFAEATDQNPLSILNIALNLGRFEDEDKDITRLQCMKYIKAKFKAEEDADG